MRPPLPRIWIITNPDHQDGPVAPLVRALEGCPAGTVGVQLRAPGAPDRDLVAWGRTLRELTRECGASLTVNRRPDIAEIVDADGVHLPERSLDPDRVRREFGTLSMIGVSRHDAEGLREAERRGASFAFLSPVFAVPRKAPPIGLEGFMAAIAGVDLPTYALGGLDSSNARGLIAAGAHGVALRRAVYESPDPNATLRTLLRALDNDTTNRE